MLYITMNIPYFNHIHLYISTRMIKISLKFMKQFRIRSCFHHVETNSNTMFNKVTESILVLVLKTFTFLSYPTSSILHPTSYILHLASNITRHVFVKHGCPRRQQSQNMAKISKSYILTPPHPQGHVMSEKCEEPIDELTVQVWLLCHHTNFKYCTLFVSGTELQTDRQTDRQTDGLSNY